mgnify:CR=1 FL=1|jgi:voltage-gated potassium channel
MRLQYFLGLGGISGVEKPPAHFAGRLFLYGTTLAAVLLLCLWHLQITNSINVTAARFLVWIIWLFFLFKLVYFLLCVEHRARYLQGNWFNVVMLVFGVPLLFNPMIARPVANVLMPIFFIVLLVPWLGFLRVSLMDGKLTTTLVSLVIIVLLAGVLMAGIDPGIHNIGEGIWWAWVTMSTVGFGDYVPVSVVGRIVASIVILFGLLFFAVLTANFSSLFIRRMRKKEQREVDLLMLKKLTDIEKRLDDIEQQGKN